MAENRLVTRRFVISGRVQGVGFRYFVWREAEALGLSGWVRNLPDGQVEVLAAGKEQALLTLEGLLWRGPRLAHVDQVQAFPAEPPAEAGFHILSGRRG